MRELNGGILRSKLYRRYTPPATVHARPQRIIRSSGVIAVGLYRWREAIYKEFSGKNQRNSRLEEQPGAGNTGIMVSLTNLSHVAACLGYGHYVAI